VYAIAVNEVNASGGRIVTSPTNGAAGVIPAVLKYIIEASGALSCSPMPLDPLAQFVSVEDPEKSISTFLLTAAAVGMLFKVCELNPEICIYILFTPATASEEAPFRPPKVVAKPKWAVSISVGDP
jgi:L-serine deaminase